MNSSWLLQSSSTKGRLLMMPTTGTTVVYWLMITGTHCSHPMSMWFSGTNGWRTEYLRTCLPSIEEDVVISFVALGGAPYPLCLIGSPLWRNEWVNSFQAIAPLTGQERGTFFKGAFLPQKLDPKGNIETKYNYDQKHVLSYILKRSPVCFVWAVPPLLISPSLLILALKTVECQLGIESGSCKS
jgi:hypothetical protein